MATKSDPLYGRQLGEFRLTERIGMGAYGAVYRCEQPALGREAVVKVQHRTHDTEEELERFLREAQLASRLEHPYAAHVYAFGVEPDGLAWIAMELVRGVTLREWLRRYGTMDLDRFAPFFDQVCEVVQAAHDRGIVHRDIKPANIMIIERCGRTMPKLLDWGIAKAIDDPVLSDALTPDGAVMCAAAYAAPESLLGHPVKPAVDVYALAVVAFEALTGRTPYRDDDIDEIGRQHCEAPIPSAGDPALDRVFARALAKKPEDRYGCALELAAAFRGVVDAQIVSQVRAAARAWEDHGRPDALLWSGDVLHELESWYDRTSGGGLSPSEIAFADASRDAAMRAEDAQIRARQWARRLSVGLAAALILGILGTVEGYERYQRQLAEQLAEDAAELARATKVTAELEQGRSALLAGDTREARRHLETAWGMGEHSRATRFMLDRAMDPVKAELARLQGNGRMWSASWSPDGRWIVTTDDKGAQIWDGTTYTRIVTLPHGDTVYAAAWMTGDRVVTACGDGVVRIWNATRGDLVRALRVPGKAPRWYALAVSGERVAAVDMKGQAAGVWDADRAPMQLDLHGDGWSSVAFSADGRLAVSGGDRVEVADSGRVAELPARRVHTVAWGPTGLATGSATGELSIWSARGALVRRLREAGGPVDLVAFAPDGRIAAGLRDGTELVFDVATGTSVSVSNHVHGRMLSLDISPDGRMLAVAASTGLVAISEVASGRQVAMFDAPRAAARSVRFGPRSQRILGATWDGTAWAWSAADPYLRWSAPALAESCGLVGGAEPDGRYLAVACVGHPTRVWDVAEDRLLAELPPLEDGERVPYPVVSAAGDRAAIARGHAAELYELPGGRLVRTVEHAAPVTALAFGLSGALVSGDAAGIVMADERGLLDLDAGIDALAVGPSGRLAVADARGRVHVDGREIDAGVSARMLRTSPDGQRLLVVPSYAGSVAPPALVDLARGAVIRLDGPQVYAARWTAIGILTAHADGAARIWSADGALRRTYSADRGFLADAALTPDWVVGVGGDGALHFWSRDGRQMWKMQLGKNTGISIGSWGIVARGVGGGMSRLVVP